MSGRDINYVICLVRSFGIPASTLNPVPTIANVQFPPLPLFYDKPNMTRYKEKHFKFTIEQQRQRTERNQPLNILRVVGHPRNTKDYAFVYVICLPPASPEEQFEIFKIHRGLQVPGKQNNTLEEQGWAHMDGNVPFFVRLGTCSGYAAAFEDKECGGQALEDIVAQAARFPQLVDVVARIVGREELCSAARAEAGDKKGGVALERMGDKKMKLLHSSQGCRCYNFGILSQQGGNPTAPAKNMTVDPDSEAGKVRRMIIEVRSYNFIPFW